MLVAEAQLLSGLRRFPENYVQRATEFAGSIKLCNSAQEGSRTHRKHEAIHIALRPRLRRAPRLFVRPTYNVLARCRIL